MPTNNDFSDPHKRHVSDLRNRQTTHLDFLQKSHPPHCCFPFLRNQTHFTLTSLTHNINININLSHNINRVPEPSEPSEPSEPTETVTMCHTNTNYCMVCGHVTYGQPFPTTRIPSADLARRRPAQAGTIALAPGVNRSDGNLVFEYFSRPQFLVGWVGRRMGLG